MNYDVDSISEETRKKVRDDYINNPQFETSVFNSKQLGHTACMLREWVINISIF
jgi:hypothetical protein